MNPQGMSVLIFFHRNRFKWEESGKLYFFNSILKFTALEFILLKLTNISAEIKGFAHQKFTLLSKTHT